MSTPLTLVKKKIAFTQLYVTIKEELLNCSNLTTRHPKGFTKKDKPYYNYKLKKPLYGLKQAPRT